MSSAEEIESYKFQLEQVELALASDPTNEELSKLQNDLKELISLFEAQLPEQTATTNPTKSTKKQIKTEEPVASALKTQMFSVDQEVLARYSGDGQFYKANITAIGGADQVFSVRFKGYNETEFVKAEDIKAIANKKRIGIFENIKKTNTTVEDANKKRKAEAEQPKTNKKKKTLEIEHKKNAWLNFAQVGKKKHSAINKKSIFKSPDNPEGKVGVVGSGKGMTTYQQRGKHIYADVDEK